MDHIILEQAPELEDPALVVAFRGWNDAGDAASVALETLRTQWHARRFAHIDPEEFYDFQVTRPMVELIEGTTRRIDWPQLTFSHVRVGGRDVVLALGTEPNLKWKTYAREVIGFARDLGVRRIITLGAFLADVAHTREVPIVGTAPSPDEAERLGLAPSRYQGPTGIVGVLADTANRTGLPTVSLWAASPHYVSSSENPKAALALIERIGQLLEVTVDVSDLVPAAQAWEDSIDEQVRQNQALVDYISGLEEADDELVAMEETDADGLAEEIERFLEQRGDG